MKEGRPSLTALLVAFARAVATHEPELARVCRDPWAEQLLPFPLQQMVTRAAASTASRQLLHALRVSLLGMGEHMALRTRLIDDAVAAGIAHGARQLVIVGAGLDSRAHRLASLSACDVYEVDFPSTQAFKRERASKLPITARALHYIPCDFEENGLAEALRTGGFVERTPTLWIWEGVTMYLTRALVASSLEVMARLSADHSRLILTYLLPIPEEQRALTGVGLAILGALSEPIRSDFAPEALAALLAAHAFSPLSDVSPRDVAAHYGLHFPRFAYGAPGERIVVAERRAST